MYRYKEKADICRVFNETVRENSGRAVRGEPPTDFEQARYKWNRLVTSSFPTLAAVLGGGAVAAAGSASAGGPKANFQNNKGEFVFMRN